MKLERINEIAFEELQYLPLKFNLKVTWVSNLPVAYDESNLHLSSYHWQNREGFWIPWTQQLGAWIDSQGKNVLIVACRTEGNLQQSDSQIMGLINLISGVCLNLKERIAIHANAISLHQKAIAFAGFSGMGKSTLTAFCLKNGAEFVTDDILTVNSDISVIPGNFRLKLYPHIGEKLGWKIPEEKYYKVHYYPEKSGAVLAKAPVSLKTLYLLAESQSDRIYTEELGPSKAIFEILHHSYFANEIIVKKPDLLDVYINFLSQIEVKKIFYPRQFDLLPQVYDSIVREFDTP